ncbi:MAG TPA: cytochrome c [Cytophagaceae bacterium]|jgi:uncharacterized membrane protein SirB2/cytochrome c5
MAKGMLHLHVTVIVIFLLSFMIKTILLLLNKDSALDKIREKTKVMEMVLGTLILLTGGYLLFIIPNIATYLIVKIVLVLIAIPIGIIGMKKKNKVMSIFALVFFIYAYGVAETGSLTFKKDKIVITRTTAEATETPSVAAPDQIIQSNSQVNLENAKAIYTQACAPCHGADGKMGAGGAKDLQVSKLSDDEKKEIILNGKGLMKSFKDQLTEQEVDQVVQYVNQLKKYDY